jgi:2-deoxy-D-gluconate 3-dehydrogenase
LTKALWSDPTFFAKSIARTPAGRWGTPDDLKGAVLFLASGASDFVTGESIVVDGGILGL